MAATAAFFPARKSRRGGGDGDPPRTPIEIDPSWPPKRQHLADVYNRVGGLIERLADESQIPVPAVLAVWFVESSGRRHTPGRAVIRFENHILFERWGRANPGLYDQHFRHGGRAPQFGPACDGSWKCHEYRRSTFEPFVACHQSQDQEYDVLDVASGLAGAEIARQCISMGGPQIMGFNHGMLGFGSASEMYDAFQGPEGAHVRGFFSFCENCGTPGQAIGSLRNLDWRTFARLYNGTGQVDTYAPLMASAFDEARRLF